MAEDIYIPKGAGKEEKYTQLLTYLEALTGEEADPMANLSNALALIHETFDYLWTGIYIVRKRQLVLGFFQGPVACTRIEKGRGVCGTAWEKEETIIVPDVEAFPGHIACSSRSRSEIVIPLLDTSKRVIGVLDIDSEEAEQFDRIDAGFLERIGRDISAWLMKL